MLVVHDDEEVRETVNIQFISHCYEKFSNNEETI